MSARPIFGPPPGPEMSIADRLVYALDLREMSQHGLEVAAHLSRGYVSRMRRGERLKFSPDLLRRVCDALDVSYEWLATGRGPLEREREPEPAPAPAPPPPPVELPTGDASLETAIAYHRGKWTVATRAAARALSVGPDAPELLPDEWAGVLDQIEAALAKIKLGGKPRG